jgi:hypothetical protein
MSSFIPRVASASGPGFKEIPQVATEVPEHSDGAVAFFLGLPNKDYAPGFVRVKVIDDPFVVAGWSRLPIDTERRSTPRAHDLVNRRSALSRRPAPSKSRQQQEHQD